MRILQCLIMVLIMFVSTVCAIENQKAGKENYRGLPYHAPTTKTPPLGVTKVSATHLKELLSLDDKPLLIDVYGAIFREESLDFDGAWLVSTPRKNIPGSVWLPNVGKETLKPIVTLYFDNNLKELTNNDTNKLLVFYCIEDCWMAWNAAKRAKEWGYVNVMWFREGVDGWKDINGPLEGSEPVNLPVND